MHSEEWIYRFDDVEVEPAAHRITRGGADLSVEPKAYAVLVVLLEQHGRALERDALLDRVWGHRHVTPGVLNRVVGQLRKALGDDAEHPRYIQTLHSLGYRFIGEVERLPALPLEPAFEEPAKEAAAEALPPQPTAEGRGATVHPPRKLRHFALASLLALVALALGWLWQRQGPPRPEASVAVLPFASLSTDPDDAYFAEGLAIELHDALSGVQGLTVAALLSPRDLRRDDDLRKLGRELGVSALLDATVRRDGQRLRINARLTDAHTGYTLWSRRYDRMLSQVFEAQSSIAEEVVGSMLGAMPKAKTQLETRLTPTRNVAAFDAYLRGLVQLVDRSVGRDDDRASAQFQAALSADPGFARAQAGVCRIEVNRFRFNRNPDAFDAARHACERARRMDPMLGEVSLALAELHQARGELDAAERLYRRAESDPARRPAAYVGLAHVAMERGDQAQAMELLQRALRLRPGDADVYANLGYLDYLGGRMPEAIAAYRRSVELAPDNAGHWSALGGLYLADGQLDAAAAALDASIRAEPNYAALSNLGELRFQQRRYREAAALQRRATALSPSDYLPWNNLGDALLADGDQAGARAAYEHAARQVERYLQADPRNAKAVAALGWFSAHLDQPERARDAARRSEALGAEPAEVALYNAQTYARLGDTQQAARRLADARKAGMPESRVRDNPFLAGAGVAAGEPAISKQAGTTPPTKELTKDDVARRTE
jgi:TolB-like protein/DNA-binding winged helix-turn-helix (wHTH) protein/tetratricopeptide (TPR) repeat protein